MKTGAINITLIIGAIVLLSLLALSVRVGSTADSVAVLKTDGMTCGACSKTVSDVLQSVKGVTVTEVDIEKGLVVVGYDTKTVTPEKLSEKVTGAGFVCGVHQVLTPEQFRQATGRDIGKTAAAASCCGKGGCCAGKQN